MPRFARLSDDQIAKMVNDRYNGAEEGGVETGKTEESEREEDMTEISEIGWLQVLAI